MTQVVTKCVSATTFGQTCFGAFNGEVLISGSLLLLNDQLIKIKPHANTANHCVIKEIVSL
jgi:hypothetical protein